MDLSPQVQGEAGREGGGAVSPRDDERERIMDAAYRCLTASNGATASITDILTAAGLSTRAFYRHFGSKDDLLMAMWRRDSDRVTAELRLSAASTGSPREALRCWIHGMIRMTADETRLRRMLILGSDEARRARGYRAEALRYQQIHQTAITEILREGVADGSFPRADPYNDAAPIHAALSQALDEQIKESGSDAARAAERVTDFVFRALGADPARADAHPTRADAHMMPAPPADTRTTPASD